MPLPLEPPDIQDWRHRIDYKRYLDLMEALTEVIVTLKRIEITVAALAAKDKRKDLPEGYGCR